MKALMFGWEFPPHILGGLGTASYGLTKGMAECGDIDITFVIPKPYGDEDKLCPYYRSCEYTCRMERRKLGLCTAALWLLYGSPRIFRSSQPYLCGF